MRAISKVTFHSTSQFCYSVWAVFPGVI